MIGRKAWKANSSKNGRQRSFLTGGHIPTVLIALLLLMGGLGMLIPRIMFSIFPTLDSVKLERAFTSSGTATIWGAVIGIVIMVIVIVLRQDELAITLIILTKLYVDWYLGLTVVSHCMAIALLIVFFLARSSQHPWVEPRASWLWVLFLGMGLLPGFYGLNLSDSLGYYLDVIFGALIIFWLGNIIAHDMVHVRRFLKIFSIFGTLIAIHVIVQVTTGVFLFKSTRYDLFLSLLANNFELGNSGVDRISSFLGDPDTAGGFFAIMLFIPLGLFAASSSLLGKLFYLVEVFLIVLGLFFSYSGGGWLTAITALVVFIVLVGRTRYRFLLALFFCVVAGVLVVEFPFQVSLQFQHATGPDEASLRFAAWQTGIAVIRAFPFTGIGLGRYVYFERAGPYRVPAEYIHLYHPHNSVLELAALGGIQLSLTFIAILVLNMYFALRVWALADKRSRSLLAGGIAAVVAVTVNSVANPSWTIAILASVGWLVLGVVSSPLLEKSLKREKVQEENKIEISQTE